jgi:membrane associated rhomboid family serine protease
MDLLFLLDSPVALTIFAITIITSLMAFQNSDLMYKFILNPSRMIANRDFGPFFTSGLIHANWSHLLFNMITFYYFAFPLEQMMGPVKFFLLYVISLVIASAPDVYRHRNNPGYNALGASGAISAVLLSMVLYYPEMKLAFIFFPIPIPGWLFALLYMGYSYWASRNSNDNIGHSAHLWGGIAGIVLTTIMSPQVALNFVYWVIDKVS